MRWRRKLRNGMSTRYCDTKVNTIHHFSLGCITLHLETPHIFSQIYYHYKTQYYNLHKTCSFEPLLGVTCVYLWVGGNHSTWRKVHLSDWVATWPFYMPSSGINLMSQRWDTSVLTLLLSDHLYKNMLVNKVFSTKGNFQTLLSKETRSTLSHTPHQVGYWSVD